MTVFVVIPTHNRCGPLLVCLASLVQQTIRPTVVIGDAGSSDGTAEMLAKSHPNMIVCRGSEKLWWTGATNLALRAVLPISKPDDWVLCLNDDTKILPDFIERLVAAAVKHPKRIVGSVAVATDATDIIVDGGNWMNWLTAAFQSFNQGCRLSDFPAGYEVNVNVLSGRGTLFPVGVFRELGLFAEDWLPHYGADYEFSARCARFGYELVVTYDSVVLSRVDLTGIHRPRKVLSLREFYQYFFSRRSACNMMDRFYLTWLTHRNVAQAIVFFCLSMLRFGVHYFSGFRPRRKLV